MRILVIEDNIKTAKYLYKGLSQNHFMVDSAYDSLEGLHLALEQQYDLIILDIMLPQMNGLELATKIKTHRPNIPIIFLTACGSLDEKIKGFNCGADDYLSKPFSFTELLARIRAILKRSQISQENVLQVADLRIDPVKHIATRNNQRLHLSAKEFTLLLLFMQRKGEVLSRTYIAEQVWDINFDTDTNAIEVAIKRLRDKVDQGFHQKLIHTVRGVGYVLQDE